MGILSKAKINIVRSKVIKVGAKGFDHEPVYYEYLVDGVLVKALEWSGRFDGPVDELTRVLVFLSEKYDLDYITTTEAQQRRVRKKVSKAMGDKWRVRKQGQYLLIEKKKTFKRIARFVPRLAIVTKIKNFVGWRQLHVGIFNSRHIRVDRRFRFLVVHGPAGIEYGSRFRPGKPSEVAKVGWPKIGKKVKRFYKSHRKSVQVVSGDCNGDQNRDFWLNWFEEQTKSTSIWRDRTPQPGTHRGGRLIDGAWIYDAD